jgi:hypothetical protein
MTVRNDTTVDQLAHTIAACIQHEVPEDAIDAQIDGIVKAAEAKAATFLHEHTGDWETGPAKSRYDELCAAEWALRRLLDEFPARPLHDTSFACDPETMEDLCRASAALSSANTLIARASRREGYRGGDVQ